MYKTGFSEKCSIMGALWVNYRQDLQDNDGWREFLDYADIGLPLAYILSTDVAKPNKESVRYINETWEVFCQLLDIDPEYKYNNLSECFDASPNSDVEDDEED